MKKKFKTSSLISPYIFNKFGYPSPKKWILDQVYNLFNLSNQKIDLKSFCIQRSISSIKYKHSPYEATLQINPNGFTIFTNQEKLFTNRGRFSIAHEIAHTFFYDISQSPPQRLFPIFQKEEEELCNIAASEILMPEFLVKDFSKHFPKPGDESFSLEILLTIASKFKVSPMALARRLCDDLDIWNSIIMGSRFLSKLKSPDSISDGPKPSWRLTWYFAPKKIRDFLYLPPIGTNPKLQLEIIEKASKSEMFENNEPISNFRIGNLSKSIEQFNGVRDKYKVYAYPMHYKKKLKNLDFGEYKDLEEISSGFDRQNKQYEEVIICIPLNIGPD
jgi:Predicted Zn peptidase